jgi:hypothetical protein
VWERAIELPSFFSHWRSIFWLGRIGRGVTVCAVVMPGCGINYAHQESRTRITRGSDHQAMPQTALYRLLSVFYPRYWDHAYRFKDVGLWAEIRPKLGNAYVFLGVNVRLMSIFWPFRFGLQNVINRIKKTINIKD